MWQKKTYNSQYQHIKNISILRYLPPVFSLCTALRNCHYWTETKGGEKSKGEKAFFFFTWKIYNRDFSCCHKVLHDLSLSSPPLPPLHYLSNLIPCYSPLPWLYSTVAFHLMVVPRTHQAHFQLWPFVLSVPSALNALSPATCMSSPFTYFNSLSKSHFLSETFFGNVKCLSEILTSLSCFVFFYFVLALIPYMLFYVFILLIVSPLRQGFLSLQIYQHLEKYLTLSKYSIDTCWMNNLYNHHF